MDLIIGQIVQDQSELSAHELEKLLCMYTSTYKYQLMCTTLGQNSYDHKILDAFYYGLYWTQIT